MREKHKHLKKDLQKEGKTRKKDTNPQREKKD
jgi:hypothetical protein